MSDRVQDRAQAGDIVADRTGGIHMHPQNRLDPVAGVGAQRLGDAIHVPGGGLAEIKKLGLDPQSLRHVRPAVAEPAGGGHQHRLARRHHVGQGRLPGAVTVADVDRRVVLGPCHPLEIRDQAGGQVDQRTLVDIRRGPVHRLQHRVRHHRRPRNRKVFAPLRNAQRLCHGLVLKLVRRTLSRSPAASIGTTALSRPTRHPR